MTTACLHQPNFLPWTKLIDKILASDVWIVYDTVQYTRTEFHSRQRLKGRDGPVWLSTPIVKAGRPRFQILRDVEVARDHDWRSGQLRLLREHYQRAPYWPQVHALLQPVYAAEHDHLVDFNVALAAALLDYLGSTTRIVRSSTLPHCGGDTTDRLIELTRAVGADEHLTSTWGSDCVRLDWARIATAGITVRNQRFVHPIYPQQHGPFLPDLSVVDLLCNLGPDSAGLLARHRHTPVVLDAAAVVDARPQQ